MLNLLCTVPADWKPAELCETKLTCRQCRTTVLWLIAGSSLGTGAKGRTKTDRRQ